jgi:hypothetical protein
MAAATRRLGEMVPTHQSPAAPTERPVIEGTTDMRITTRHVAAAGGAAALAILTALGGVAVASSDDGTAVSTPISATPSASVDDHGGQVSRDQRNEPGDDRRPNGTATSTPSTSRTSDDGATHDAGDDHGDDNGEAVHHHRGRDHAEDGTHHSSGHEAGDDHGGRGGSDDSGSGHGGGHGSDD